MIKEIGLGKTEGDGCSLKVAGCDCQVEEKTRERH